MLEEPRFMIEYAKDFFVFAEKGESATPNNTIDKLRQISFFANMSDHDLQQIARITVVNEYAEGAVIIEELAEGQTFCIISHGKIEITKKYGDQEEFVLGVYSDGDFFGEMALLDEGRRSATVRALEPTTLLEISKNDFQPLLFKAPVLAYNLLKELSVRLRTTGALLVSYLQQRNRRLRAAFTETLRNVAQAAKKGNAGQGTPLRRATDLALQIGREMNLSEEDLLVLEMRTLLHDLGAGDVTTQELEDLEPLSLDEAGKERVHAAESAESPDARPLLEREVSHVFHNVGDGKARGFPEDFLGTDTYQTSSIIAVAEAFASVPHDKLKGKVLDLDAVIEITRKGAGRWLDPEVLRALRRLLESGSIERFR